LKENSQTIRQDSGNHEGTRDHIANMRWIMERQLEYGQEVHVCFIDYSKAVDCINHEPLWKTLLKMGMLKHLNMSSNKLYVLEIRSGKRGKV